MVINVLRENTLTKLKFTCGIVRTVDYHAWKTKLKSPKRLINLTTDMQQKKKCKEHHIWLNPSISPVTVQLASKKWRAWQFYRFDTSALAERKIRGKRHLVQPENGHHALWWHVLLDTCWLQSCSSWRPLCQQESISVIHQLRPA